MATQVSTHQDEANFYKRSEVLRRINGLLAQQREMVLQRDRERLVELNDSLQEALLEVQSGEQQTGDGQPIAVTPEDEQLVEQDRELLRSIKIQTKINDELLADAVAYTEFTLELLCPHAYSSLYDQNGQRDNSHMMMVVNRSA